MSMSINLTDGTIKEVTLQKPTACYVGDCRAGSDGFVNIQFGDGHHTVQTYVPTAMVGELLGKLAALFAPKQSAERSDDE